MGTGAPSGVTAWARGAERAGFGSAWIMEAYSHPGAYALAAAAAAVTERLTIGLGVVNPYTRHPALLAMETATLADIAPRRVVLRLRAGGRRGVEDPMANPPPPPPPTPPPAAHVAPPPCARPRATPPGDPAPP